MNQDGSENKEDLYRSQEYISCRTYSIPSIKYPSISSIERMYPKQDRKRSLIGAILESGIEAVTHLNEDNLVSRILWRMIILTSIVFVTVLCTMQITKFMNNPVSTNYEIEYPSKIQFPSIAICNNNQNRLSYLEKMRTSNVTFPKKTNLKSLNPINPEPFDEVIKKHWDMDAVEFLNEVKHIKSQMILGCWWPNQRPCRMSDFETVWTSDGLCYAINTDKHNILEAGGSGSTNSLTLLLNVEKYEHVDLCTHNFRSKRQSGFKLYLYDQDDEDMLSSTSVNIPTGHTVDIPFWMVKRSRLPGRGCSKHQPKKHYSTTQFNITSGARHDYLKYILAKCGCSMHELFIRYNSDKYKKCNVDQYFGCVMKYNKQIEAERKFKNWETRCDTTEYTAWQDMLGLPNNIIPAQSYVDASTALFDGIGSGVLFETEETISKPIVKEDDVEQDTSKEHFSSKQQHHCEQSTFLTRDSARKIWQQAQSSMETLYEYKDEYLPQKKIEELKLGLESLENDGWGFRSKTFRNTFNRSRDVPCFANIVDNYQYVMDVLSSDSHTHQKNVTFFIQSLLEETVDRNETKSREDLRKKYGQKIVKEKRHEVEEVFRALKHLSLIFNPSSYFETPLEKELSGVWTLLELIEKRQKGNITKRDFLNGIRPFYEQLHDAIFEVQFKKLVNDFVFFAERRNTVDRYWSKINTTGNGTLTRIVNEIFQEYKSKETVLDVIDSMQRCARNQLNSYLKQLSEEIHQIGSKTHESYDHVFVMNREMEPVRINDKFKNENFALVNIFLHRMSIEKWTQNEDYSFWSLASDIGGAIDLFLGASLLTMIELAYLFMKHGLCGFGQKRYEKWFRSKRRQNDEKVMCDDCLSEQPSFIMKDRSIFEEEKIEEFHDAVEFLPRMGAGIESRTRNNKSETLSYGSKPSQLYLTPISIRKQMFQT